MPASRVSLSVWSRRGEVGGAAQVSSQARLADLRGKKIGILNNGKAGGEMLLPYLEAALKDRIPGVELRRWLIPFAAAADAKEPKLKEMAEYADAIIALTGD